ncbi:MAG: SpoIIE family protein phosphatase [Oscillospiraceae bacterium]|nr:SpoIIE family protein phosphatase [Oscillospiraceae bacterium]
MKVIWGIKFGGLQQKIYNLVLLFIVLLIGIYTAVSLFQEKNLSETVTEANALQQQSIITVSEETMDTVVKNSMTQNTALQAYIADDLFNKVRSDVMVLQTFAEKLFEHADEFQARTVAYPDPAKDGIPTVQLLHEDGVNPDDSSILGLAANMGEIMLSMYEASDHLGSCFIATADGNIIYVDDRSGSYFSEEGEMYTFAVRERPWYLSAVEAGKIIFTGIELDAYTDIPGVVCAAPVYRDGELVAVVGADLFLYAVRSYIEDTASEGSFVCIVNEQGNVIFSPQTEGVFRVEVSDLAEDLRNSENTELAAFVQQALTERTEVEDISIDGKEWYLAGAPMGTAGWTVITVVDKELTRQPTALMLQKYNDINNTALQKFETGVSYSKQTIITATLIILALATIGALLVAKRIVKPIEHMTRRINALRGSDSVFEMEDSYRTNDEIEILAQSFATLSERTRNYITEITRITAEKERIGTELALATRIQADMLPNIYPAFPERPEFDIYATMKPAKEVGGDFYDFFLVDENHLGLVIADVSGKGVPAALFMMISKILIQNDAMAGNSPAQVLQAVNERICSNNREEMFVTVWLGILDLRDGTLTAANAGHEYPILRKPDGDFEVIKDKHGFVLGGMSGVKYREYTLRMEPGSKLFLYTDGVPEATNESQELFGLERALEALKRTEDSSPKRILEAMDDAVKTYVGDAPQFDDLTMLCVHYIGREES